MRVLYKKETLQDPEKEQQTQIDEQNKLINFLIDIICEDNPDREICLEN